MDAQRKKWLVIGGGAVGLVLVILLYKRGASGSSASSADSSGTDPLTGLPYSEDNSTDPLTGMTYLAEAQQYGSVSAAESQASSGSEFGLAGGSGGFAGTAGYPTSNVSGGSVTSTSYATNAAWAQAVTSGLVGLGYSSTDVAAALGLFFAQHPLSTGADGVSYAEIIQAAEAEFGPPPQGTYQIIPAGTTSSTTPPAAKAGAISNLQAYSVKKSSFTARWNPASGAAGGYAYAITELNGHLVKKGTTTGTSVSASGLHPGWTYNVSVQGLPGGPGDNIHVALPTK